MLKGMANAVSEIAQVVLIVLAIYLLVAFSV